MRRCLLAALALVAATGAARAGSCADHIKILNIANIQSDGGDILVRSDYFRKGAGFAWAVNESSHFRIQAGQNADFRKNAMAQLLSAKAASEVVYFQVSNVAPYLFQIEKISVGESTLGLDCASY